MNRLLSRYCLYLLLLIQLRQPITKLSRSIEPNDYYYNISNLTLHIGGNLHYLPSTSFLFYQIS